MGISRIHINRMAILTVLVALSVGMAVAVNSGVGASNKTSNVGSNTTTKVSITGVNSTEVDQWIEIANNGTFNVSLTGWKLMNKENLTYAFPASFVLKPGAQVKVHSMSGKPDSTDLYNSSILLNKAGDMATLKDANGKVVSKYAYPAVSIAIAKATTNASKSNAITPNVMNQANTTKTIISNVTTSTAKDTTKITKSS
jgi:hypothetical protein